MRGAVSSMLGALVLVLACDDAYRDAEVTTLTAAGSAGRSAAAEAGSAETGTGGCVRASEQCVKGCLLDHAITEEPTCTTDGLKCPSGFVFASTCPELACGVTPDACCDPSSGNVSESACNLDGYRSACPEPGFPTYRHQATCIPPLLGVEACIDLEGQPCAGPALHCQDLSLGEVTCDCEDRSDGDGAGAWDCRAYLGP